MFLRTESELFTRTSPVAVCGTISKRIESVTLSGILLKSSSLVMNLIAVGAMSVTVTTQTVVLIVER